MDDPIRERLRELLASAPVLGAEVDLTYRVLALTIEPETSGHPVSDTTDRRLQVLFHPVGTIAAALVRHDPASTSGPTVLTFEPEHLPDVVAALDGPVPLGDPLPVALPDLHAMESRLSLRGMAQVAEGHDIPLSLSLATGDLTLDLWATFDDVEVRTPDGEVAQTW